MAHRPLSTDENTQGTAYASVFPEGHPVLEISDANFDVEVLASRRPFLVNFGASWCKPCRLIGPTVARLAADYAGIVCVGQLDVAANPATRIRLGVRRIPALLLFVDGELQESFIGTGDLEALRESLDQYRSVESAIQ